MSDERKYMSPDIDRKFAWPATEVPQERRRVQATPIQDLRERDQNRRHGRYFREARELARRWEAGDEVVTIRDIIEILTRE